MAYGFHRILEMMASGLILVGQASSSIFAWALAMRKVALCLRCAKVRLLNTSAQFRYRINARESVTAFAQRGHEQLGQFQG
jgi:hypothetical protein